MSSLNFKTHNVPQEVCSTTSTQTFDPTTHVNVGLYKGHGLVLQTLDGVYTVHNVSDAAMGLPETLLTLVLSPKDATADQYFADFPDEVINLDELYISHALDQALLPDTVTNTITGVSAGRSSLTLDAGLLTNCPIEDDSLNYQTAECVTTQDWSLQGSMQRPQSGQSAYFVRRVTGVAEDVEWLQSNVFAQNSQTATTFLQQTENLVPNPTRRLKSQIYWVFPVYKWFDSSPIGLKDTAIVSFAWSISKTPALSRRLLSYESKAPRLESLFATPANQTKRSRRRALPGPAIKLNVVPRTRKSAQEELGF